ncbi:hypothetical protein LC653_41495 [Nostoc sp. CHAB 5784]|uniref:hypothetical protein n=1 Tax=Nostoc mirabile TaxID=2907820 RepID=UPI001E337EAC|nr:hypothetical protein [Nostoc mirabile]MCC5670100.1 hypothetical protein [Nostoc mirabile CHAB5784]
MEKVTFFWGLRTSREKSGNGIDDTIMSLSLDMKQTIKKVVVHNDYTNPAKPQNTSLTVSPGGMTTQEKDLKIARYKNIGNNWDAIASFCGSLWVLRSFNP